MSRQSHSKKNVTTIAFLFIIASIGFPFQSITIPTNFGSDYQVVNFFLGNGLVGKSIFDPSTYEQEVVLQAFAEHPTNTTDDIYPMVKRMETAEDTQLSETRHITKLGLPRHVEDNQGNFVANLVNEDENGIQLESGTFSYWFDYSSCSMSIFDVGRIGSITQPIFKSNNWVTKVAVNGTTDWTDVSQNFLPCVVTNDISSSGVIINSTKSDVNGTITEIYKYSKYGGMKTFVSFTNNDPSLTNHMFSFSNILLDVPPSISFVDSVGLNATEKNNFYSQFEGDLQPIVMGGLGTVIPSVNQTTIIHEINRQDFFSDYQFNGTIYSEQITDRFLWIQRVDNAEYRNWDYIFQNPDDFDKLNKIEKLIKEKQNNGE